MFRQVTATCIVAAALAPAAAQGSTPVGAQTTNFQACSSSLFAFGRTAPYIVPADGVITKMEMRGGEAASGSVSGMVVRPTTGSGVRVVGVSPAQTFTAVHQLKAVAVRIAVRAGDLL